MEIGNYIIGGRFNGKQLILDLQKENEALKEQIKQLNEEKYNSDLELQQIYSHLGVEAFGEDIQEQAVKEIDRLKEQLTEQIDYKEEYYTYWQQAREENEKLKEQLELKDLALRMACETIKEIMPDKPLYICGGAIAERLGIPQTSEIKDYDYFIEQAKESIDGK